MSIVTAARHSSASNEHYTPPEIVEAARALLGGRIDLDPASSAVAQETVRAMDWIGLDQTDPDRRNGLTSEWWIYRVSRSQVGTVFLNPPGGLVEINGRRASSQKVWWRKLADEYGSCRVTAAVFVCFSVEFLQTAQVDNPPIGMDSHRGLVPTDFPICFPSRRIAYLRPDGAVGGRPPHSSCIVYLPPKWHAGGEALEDLRRHFGWLGVCR